LYPLDSGYKQQQFHVTQYDKEKYKEMVLDAAETVLGYFDFDRSVYGNIKKGGKKWFEQLREHRTREIETDML
jgi:hypothetical protein